MRTSAKQFWKEKKEKYMYKKSIKSVFRAYQEYCKEREIPVLKEFIFRAYIRKNGYKPLNC